MDSSYRTSAMPQQTGSRALRRMRDPGLHLINTHDAQARACWFLLRADVRQLARLAGTAASELIDLTQYGQIVASGWGHRIASIHDTPCQPTQRPCPPVADYIKTVMAH